MLYFDNAATTSVDLDVLNIYSKALKEYYNNTSSTHRFGVEGNKLLSQAKTQIAKHLGSNIKEEDIIFTSGATESNNLGIKGYVNRYFRRGKHIITTKVEHPSVINVYKTLEEAGFEVTYLNVNENGVDIKELESNLRKDTILVSIMAVNNETGTIFDIENLSKLVKKKSSAAFFCDATQAIFKVNIDYTYCDLISFSAHKLHGIKGSGVLIKRSDIDLIPLFDGGGQENGYRSGTINLPAAIALATTLRKAKEGYLVKSDNIKKINAYLRDELSKIEEVHIVSPKDASPYILNFILTEHKASVIAEALSTKDIMVSTKSACSSKKVGGSYVLKALGYDDYSSGNAIRLSFNGDEKIEDCQYFIKILKELLSSIRKDQK